MDSGSLLRKYLEAHLRVPEEVSSKCSLQCIVLTDGFTNGVSNLTMQLCNRHLILLVAKSTLSQDSPVKGQAVVLGVQVLEYGQPAEGIVDRIYIQQVDTTGQLRPRKWQGWLTRQVLSILMRYWQDVLGVRWVHLFAAARPSLLFSGSELLGRKRPLGARALIAWWCALLASQPLRQDSQVYIYSPFDEMEPSGQNWTRQLVQRLQQATHCAAIYGVPWQSVDVHQSAASLIPLFSEADDPKWRHWESLSEQDENQRTVRNNKRVKLNSNATYPTVWQFMETMGCRVDFSLQPSALIIIQLRSTADASAFRFVPRRAEQASIALKMLKGLTFATEAEVLKSTVKLVHWLRLIDAPSFSVEEHALQPVKDDFRQLLESIVPQIGDSNVSINNHQPSSPMGIQELVKRKRPTTM